MQQDEKRDMGTKGFKNQEVNIGRRKLAKAGIIATPVLMSLTGRNAMGAQCSPSGFMSGNLSNHGHENDTCGGGYSPGYWGTHPEEWPNVSKGDPVTINPGTCDLSASKGSITSNCTVYNSDGTMFHEAFAGSAYVGMTMMQVLWEQEGSLAFHAVASFLNAVMVPGYGVPVQTIVDMVNSVLNTGYYVTGSGDEMNEEDVKDYLISLYH